MAIGSTLLWPPIVLPMPTTDGDYMPGNGVLKVHVWMPYLGIFPTCLTLMNNLKWTILSPSRSFTYAVPPRVPVTKENIFQVIKRRRVSKNSNIVSCVFHRMIKTYAVHVPSLWLEGSINTETTPNVADNGPALVVTIIVSHERLKNF